MRSGSTTRGTSLIGAGSGTAASDTGITTIVLVAGAVKIPDRMGHHDYRAGCALLAFLLGQTAGLRAIVVPDGWPEEERVLASARVLVVYSGGGRKLAFLESPQRIECLQRLVDQGVGLVMIHQAVSYPPEFAPRAASWIGGVHVAGKSGRGHWATQHREFPAHPVTRGVEPWQITDGWLNQIEFISGTDRITPLVWSGRTHRGSRAGGVADVVSWVYERPDGGRSFCFTGLDAHSAWSVPGIRRLLVNGILWTAGLTVPEMGAPCAIDQVGLSSYLTPRGSKGELIGAMLRRGGRRLVGLFAQRQTARQRV